MNKKALKSLLNEEIKNAAPNVLDDVVKSSYIEKPTADTVTKKSPSEKRMGKGVLVAMSCCLVLALVVTGVAVYFTRDKGTLPAVSNASYTTVAICNSEGGATACEVAETPTVSFTADSDGKIESVRADNAAGEKLLLKTEDGKTLTGLQLDEGVSLIVDAAARLGYIDVTATAATADARVDIKVAATAGVKPADVQKDVKTTVEGYLKQNGIFAYVSDSTYTTEELVAEIQQFDATATLNASIAELNAVLAQRKPYYEEKYNKLSQTYSQEVALFLGYIDTARDSLAELKVYLIGLMDTVPYSLMRPMISAYCDQIDNVLELIDVGVSVLEGVYAQAKAAIDILIAAIPSQLSDTVAEYVRAVPETVAELGEYIEAVTARHAEELYNLYVNDFNETREVISDEDYLEFSAKFEISN